MSRKDRSRFLTGLFAVLALWGASLVLSAAYSPAGPMAWAASPDSVDRAMVALLSKADHDEVVSSRAAMPGLQDPEVKRFAQRMIDDHDAALTAITAIAHRLRYPLAPEAVAATPANAAATTAVASTPPVAAAPSTSGTGYASGSGTPMGSTGTPMGSTAAAPGTGGSTADADYLTSQVMGHESLLGQLPTDMTKIKDAGLRQHVTSTKRTVQMHLDDAKRLQNRKPGGTP